MSNAIDAKGSVASVVISDAANNVVDIFSEAGKQLGQLTGFSQPQGLGLDKQGNLYVADTNNSRIQVYASGFQNAPQTIDDSGQSPVGVAVDRSGNIAVANILTSSGQAGSVSFFSSDGTMLTTLSNANFAKVIFEAFDSKGNLYIDGTNASGGFVAGEIVGGVEGKTIAVLSTGNTIGYPGGIAITKSGEIAICDQENREIFTYNAPAQGSFGMPVATTTLSGAGDPINIVFTKTNKGIWLSDPAGGGPADKVLVPSSDKYLYPAGTPTKAIFFSHGAQPTGIVLTRNGKS
ncbi:MAG TPA: NHL repeat-containing protein [Candidatus Tumulicola sp.]